MRDFADAIGVSKTTVSKAFTGNGRIAPETRDAILRAARELNFDPNPHAQRLSSGVGTNLVGLFCPGANTGAAARKALRIQQMLDEQGWDAPLYTSGLVGREVGRDQRASLRRLCLLRPRLLVCSTVTLEAGALDDLRAYQAAGGLVVCFDTETDLAADSVFFDRRDNTFQATRHLLDLGHRKVGLYVVGVLDAARPAGYMSPRLQGFADALAQAGLSPRPDWLFDGYDDEEFGARMAARFLRLADRPTAMVVVNERVASAFLNQVQRAGVRVPSDLSIVSHDDLPVARYAAVPLTTVSHPAEQIAGHVADLARGRLAEPEAPPRRIMVRGNLIRRESTAAPSLLV